jgi:hypothetical protein
MTKPTETALEKPFNDQGTAGVAVRETLQQDRSCYRPSKGIPGDGREIPEGIGSHRDFAIQKSMEGDVVY